MIIFHSCALFLAEIKVCIMLVELKIFKIPWVLQSLCELYRYPV